MDISYDVFGRPIMPEEHHHYITDEVNEQSPLKQFIIRLSRDELLGPNHGQHAKVMTFYNDDERLFFQAVCRIAMVMAEVTPFSSSQDLNRTHQAIHSRLSCSLMDIGHMNRMIIDTAAMNFVLKHIEQCAKVLKTAMPNGIWKSLSPAWIRPDLLLFTGVLYG